MIAAGMKKGEILPGPPCKILRVLALDHVESADAGGDVNARRYRQYLGVIFRPAMLHAEIRGGQSQSG